MIPWILGLTLLTTPIAVDQQDSCQSARPVRLTPSVIPVIGQSPMWAATGGKPLVWEGPMSPVRLLWLRDVAARGPAFLSGKIASGDPAAATKTNVSFATSMYGGREPRLKLDHIGDKPAGIKDADLQKYAFHWTFVWFPSPGCYAITGSVGSQKSVIFLNVAPAPKKTT